MKTVRTNREWLELILVWSALALIFIVSLIIILCTQPKKSYLPEEQILDKLAGPEQEPEESIVTPIQDKSQYPDNLLAPFVDMVSWVDPSSAYSINGVPNLAVFYDETGCEYFCLGFVRSDNNNPIATDGSIRWGWGGFYELSEKGNDGYQYEGIKDSIQNIRDKGGNIVVSVGGQLGSAPWMVTSDVQALKKMYKEIISAYDISRLDLDIEESNQGYEENIANAKAIKKVQDETNVEIVLTIPIMPYGWTDTQKNLIRAYLGAGVNVSIFNNMTMCYGSEVNPGEDFAEASIRATDNACKQLIDLYKEYGVELSQDEAYHKLGATVDIGFENSYNPIFTATMTKTFAEYAKEKNLAMYSFWCMNRDAMLETNSAIHSKYSFFDASLAYFDK